MTKQAGVYTILNLVTGRRYVGSSGNVAHRWNHHLSKLNRGVHVNDGLQADWTRYGPQSFSWTLTQSCETRADAIRAEQVHIEAHGNLYNAARRAGGGPRDGFRHTEDSKRKMSASKIGKPKPEGFGAKISAWKSGRPNPAHSAALRGRKLSSEHSEAIRRGNTGKVRTDELKARMSEKMTGRLVTWGEKISAGKKGKPWSALRRARFEATHFEPQ